MNELENKYYKAEKFFFSNISKEFYEFQENINIFVSKVNSPNFNFIVKHAEAVDQKLLIDQAKSIFNKNNLQWVLVVNEEYCSKTPVNILEDDGLSLIDESVAMYYQLNCIFK